MILLVLCEYLLDKLDECMDAMKQQCR